VKRLVCFYYNLFAAKAAPTTGHYSDLFGRSASVSLCSVKKAPGGGGSCGEKAVALKFVRAEPALQQTLYLIFCAGRLRVSV